MEQFPFKTRVVRESYEYWLGKCQGGRLPRRRDIRPEEIARLLPNIFLVDVVGDPPVFKFRLVGTKITEWAAGEYTGVTVNEAEYGPNWRRVYDSYLEAVHRRAPVYSEYSAPWKEREFLFYERIIAPLSDDGVTVNMLFGALDVVSRSVA
ncbi:MAG TPA: PAS domain-containing protein [Alphaproteobacteria bacterium]|jgi:hypothetical protein